MHTVSSHPFCCFFIVYCWVKFDKTGDRDELVPPVHMRTLHNLAVLSTHRDYFSVAGGTHNDTFEVAGIEYYRRLHAFIKSYVQHANSDADSAEHLAGAQEVTPDEVLRSDSSSSSKLDEDSYLFVDKDSESVALPTMTTNFQVK